MATLIPDILMLILLAFIVLIMNLAGLELAAGKGLNWDREFKATTRLTGVTASLVIGSALFLGDGILELVPVALTAGIVIFAGIGMLDEGLLRSYRQLSGTEFMIVIAIFITILAFGLLMGVGVGLVATLIFFTVSLSRVDTIESRFTLRERHSKKARSVTDRALLVQEGKRVRGYQLRGYIFFGSVYPLVDELRQRLNDDPPRPAPA